MNLSGITVQDYYKLPGDSYMLPASLRSLFLYDPSFNLMDRKLIRLIKSLVNLRELDIGLTRIRADTLLEFSEALVNLTSLSMAGKLRSFSKLLY